MASSSSKVDVKVEKLCRTCLSKENELNSIFDVKFGTNTLDFVVAAITGLKIRKGDGLPSTICCVCKEKAENAYDFKNRSQEAHIILKGYYKKEREELLPKDKANDDESKRVKTENSTFDDNDDLSEADYNYPLSNAAEETIDIDLDVRVKCEKQENEMADTKKGAQAFATGTKQEIKTKCVKVEFEYDTTFCPICETSYDGDNSLSKHMWEFHPDLMGPKKRGRPKKAMTSIILNKLSENGLLISSTHGKTYKCHFCKKHTETKDDLNVHMYEHKDTKVLCCILCKKIFMKKKFFDSHLCTGIKSPSNITDSESSNNIQSDKNGQMAFATEILLQELFDPDGDMITSTVQVCSACSGIYLSEADLINHHDAEHPELSLRCNHCSKVFASVKTAARHRVMCKDIERTHKCSTCGLKFAYEISLNKHILRYHQGQSVSVAFMNRKPKSNDNAQYECDTCSKIFHRKEALAKHTKLHMPNQKLYECEICQKKFNRSDNLRTHKKIHDVDRSKSRVNNCLCLYCGRGFSNSSNLIVHMRRHTGEKPYKCDFCGKGFPRSSDLMVHRRSHTGEKPCVCLVCGKAFSRSNKLTRHMRVHTGQRPYKCTYCDKAFSQSNDLTLHIRRHTGDKPYVCEVCGERFIQGTALQNHRRAHGHFPPSQSDISLQLPTSVVNTYPVSNITTLTVNHGTTHLPN